MAANCIFLRLLCIFATAIVVHGQSQAGYISIDCGAPTNINYIDTYTGISYTSDGAFIKTGVNMKVSAEYGYPANPVLPFPLADVRAFPQGNRNCYSLNPADGKGNLYLIRASFMYGNYDGRNTLPEFDLYVNVNFWSSVRFRNASEDVIREIISFAELDTIYVCLVNKGMGTPFISALELRPLNNSIYGTEFGRNVSLVLYQRWDTGYLNGTGRYKDDIYDRIWSSYMSASWASTLASAPVDIYLTGYEIPVEVIETAASPIKDNDPLELKWTSDDPYARFYAYLHFAELKALKKTDKREIKIFWNGSPVSGAFVPLFLVATTIYSSRAFTGNDHLISIQKTADSTLPPLLNAIEIFTAQQLSELSTAIEDVAAIQSIRSLYRVKKIWAGDPCSPRKYPWEGLQCTYNNSLPPRIISLNLSSSELQGPIAFCIGNLSLLESLDLSNNSLVGPVPEFLDDLKQLKFLNLNGNKLSGFISASLVKRSKAGVLALRVDDQNLCLSSSCQNKNNVIVPAVVATLVSALLLILVIGWFLRRQRKAVYSGPLLPSSKRKFSPTEVSNITSNFHNVIGKGGFGVVYLGRLEDGTEVAVKMINDTSSSEKSKGSSSRVSKEFQMEAELLLTVHHRNLASFIGYCDAGRKMALIYEYMSNGNLEDYLSGEKAENLSWEMRLRIAIDAAQGLEYLHHGCKPPIIHRDVKTANILLSQDLDAKIADFGLSKVFPTDYESHVVTAVMGTPGYVDPEYYNTFKLNEKSDVYSFGIVLLELITGQPAIVTTDNGDKINVIRMVEPSIKAGDINSIVDQRLRRDFGINSAWKYLEVAMWCIRERGSQRPTMNQIVMELKHCLAVELDTDHQHQRYKIETQMKLRCGGNEYDSSGSMSRRYEDCSVIGPTAR